jgi:hypothetical protein
MVRAGLRARMDREGPSPQLRGWTSGSDFAVCRSHALTPCPGWLSRRSHLRLAPARDHAATLNVITSAPTTKAHPNPRAGSSPSPLLPQRHARAAGALGDARVCGLAAAAVLRRAVGVAAAAAAAAGQPGQLTHQGHLPSRVGTRLGGSAVGSRPKATRRPSPPSRCAAPRAGSSRRRVPPGGGAAAARPARTGRPRCPGWSAGLARARPIMTDEHAPLRRGWGVVEASMKVRQC